MRNSKQERHVRRHRDPADLAADMAPPPSSPATSTEAESLLGEKASPTNVPSATELPPSDAATTDAPTFTQTQDMDDTPAGRLMREMLGRLTVTMEEQTKLLTDGLVTKLSEAAQSNAERINDITQSFQTHMEDELSKMRDLRTDLGGTKEKLDGFDARLNDVNKRIDDLQPSAPEPEPTAYEKALKEVKRFASSTSDVALAAMAIAATVHYGTQIYDRFNNTTTTPPAA